MRSRWALVAIMLVLGTGWGSTQSTGKLAVSTGHAPFGVIFWQLAIATVLLGGLTLVRGRRPLLTQAALRFYVIVAFLGTLIPNLAFYVSITHLSAGVMAIIISLVPMLALPMSVALGMDRFSPMRLAGLGLGLTGVVLIAWSGGEVSNDLSPGWLALAVVGPVFYAMEGTYVARNGTAGMEAMTAMLGASAAGMVICLPVALVSGQFFWPPLPFGVAEWSLVVMSVSHACLYAGYVWLAVRAGAVFASQTSYVVTGTGVFWAMLLLGERFPPLVWLALVVMLSGVALVQPRQKQAEGDACLV